jgi:hypothetical protein
MLNPLSPLDFNPLLADKLSHPQGRGSLKSQVPQQGAVVARIFLLAQARTQVYQAD